MKKIISIIIIIFLMCSFLTSVYADTSLYEEKDYADILKVVGLFKGTNKGYELQRTATRIEAAVMLVRLLGKEEEAILKKLSHPFSDVPIWADPYIGYMYNYGLTKGMGGNKFGSYIPVTPQQYSAFVLRSLKYSESKGDFTYSDALGKIVDVGLTDNLKLQGINEDKVLTRGELVKLSFWALMTKMNNSGDFLIDYLVKAGTVSEYTKNALGIVKPPEDIEYKNGKYVISDKSSLDKLLKQALLTMKPQVLMDVRSYSGDIKNDITQLLKKNDMYAGTYKGAEFKWHVNSNNKIIDFQVDIKYTMSKRQKDAVIKYACNILADLISNDMSDYDKELAIHDYLVNRTTYGFSKHSYDSYGVFAYNKAVCQGYSRAMLLMSSLAGVYCIEVSGTDEGVSHSWNIVKIGGEFYHVDVSNDDPVGAGNVLRHFYFNVTDNDLINFRQWDRSLYPKCNSLKYNYHTVNNAYIKDITELKGRLIKDYNNGKRKMEYRLLNFDKNDFTNESMIKLIKYVSLKVRGDISEFLWSKFDKMNTVVFEIK